METAEEYWDKHAKQHGTISKNNKIIDNVWKRSELVRRLLNLDLYQKKVLEIGVGTGTAFAAIRLVWQNAIQYTCTDMSQRYVDFVKKYYAANAIKTDIKNLPGDEKFYDYVIALDVLEHVNPDDRYAGYKEIDRVLTKTGKVVLNIPLGESFHDNYDWGFDNRDLMALMNICDLQVVSHERYRVHCKLVDREYEWFIGQRKINSNPND